MVDHASTSIPKPKNWQDFERCCCILFECVLGDPHTQRNGRSGQPQHGVDVFGRRGGEGGPWVGIQCKGKEGGYGGAVTEAELRREVDKARHFTPPIVEFILVTTAPDDAHIQEVAREITQESANTDHSLSVAVWGWGHLESHISEHARALRAFSPDATLYTDQVLRGLERFEEGRLGDRELLHEILLIVRSSQAVSETSDDSTAVLELLDKHLHAEIDGYRDLINEGRPETALRFLDQLKDRIWDNATSRIRFRLLTNSGAAKLKLRDETGASEAFLAAIQYDSTDKIGMANVALAFLLRGDRNSAAKAAQEALERDSTNSNAASYLIQALVEDDSVEDPFQLFTTDLRDTAPVRLAAINFYRDRGSVEWRSAAREAALLFPDHRMFQRLAAEADLDEVLASQGSLLGAEIPESNGSRVERATGCLSQFWEDARQNDARSVDLALPQNLAQAYLMEGDEDSAARVLDEALGIAPTHAGLRLLRAKVHMLCDEAAAALRLLKSELQGSEAELLCVLALLRVQKPEDALVTIDALLGRPLDEGMSLKARLLRVEVLQAAQRFDEAFEAVSNFTADFPENVRALCMLANLQKAQGKEKLALETLGSTSDYVTDETPLEDRLILAECWINAGEAERACELLEGRVDTTRDNVALRTWLWALSEADWRARSRQLFASLPPGVAELPFYLRMHAELQLRMQDLAAALATVERYLQLRPTDLELHLVLASILLRREGEPQVRQLLEDERKIEALQGTPEQQLELAHLLLRLSLPERAFQIAYKTLLAHQESPQVHLRFVGLAMSREDVDGIPLDITVVDLETVFTVKNARSEQADYLITADEFGPPGVVRLAPNSDLAKVAIGLGVGDPFPLAATSPMPQDWRICSIKHKWLWALHDTMERFERRFPAQGGLNRVVLPAQTPEGFQPIFDWVRARSEAVQSALQEYASGWLPLDFLARRAGSDVINAYVGLQEHGRSFRVCLGNEPEREAARSAIFANQRRGCVLDALTLSLIRRLHIWDAVTAVCGRPAVVETSLDILRDRLERARFSAVGQAMSLCYTGGRFYRTELTPEEAANVVGEFEGELAFANEHCQLLPAVGYSDPPAELRKLDEMLAGDFLDAALAAQGANLINVCEDLGRRLILGSTLEVRTTWLQPVLMAARDSSLITEATYNEAVISLVAAHHDHRSIDAGVLLGASRMDKGALISPQFASVAGVLGGQKADMVSHLAVAAEFLRRLWRGDESLLRQMALTGRVLESLLREHWADWQVIVAEFQRRCRHQAFANYVRNWLQGHFLPPI